VFIAVVVFVNLVAIIQDIDARASDSEKNLWVDVVAAICFTIFVLEFTCRLWVERMNFFTSYWNLLDFLVVFTGALEYTLTLTNVSLGNLGLLRVVRLCRLLRLLRVLRLFSVLGELKKLLQMMALA
jgi:hypothetical protein